MRCTVVVSTPISAVTSVPDELVDDYLAGDRRNVWGDGCTLAFNVASIDCALGGMQPTCQCHG
jgi:hypothetical protein